MTKTLEKEEFGDFQTPYPLAVGVCSLLAQQGVSPKSIVEPTCGNGAFLTAALRYFPGAEALGFEINPAYAEKCRQSVAGHPQCKVSVADFFQLDWKAILATIPDSVLIIGNPPWVTNAALASIGSSNLPTKSNSQGHRGLDAITGKSNFDISEWMLVHLLERLDGRNATVAMLCKTVVARKVLKFAWKHKLQISRAEIRRIDASSQFNAAVDACLLICNLRAGSETTVCQVYGSLSKSKASYSFGFDDERLIANLGAYAKWQHLLSESSYRWRSGIKHDCSKVMELYETPQGLRNGLGEDVEVEYDCLYPMLKSSELANGRTKEPRRWMIVTQRETGQDTSELRIQSPKLWNYLLSHSDSLDQRGSTIYRKRPRFSVFGVGSYSFSPWKIAVSGFYKSLNFVQLSSFRNKPIMLDDTAYMIACKSQREAEFLLELLSSEAATEFYSSLIFWDSKRPITTELLSTLSLDKLAAELGRGDEFSSYSVRNPWTTRRPEMQSMLFS